MARERFLLGLLIVVGWTLYGLVSASGMAGMTASNGDVIPLDRALRMGLASGWIWIPCSFALVWCVQRYPIERGRIASGIVAFSLVVLFIVLLRAWAVMALNPWVHWYLQGPVPPFPELLVVSLRNNALLAWLMVGAVHAWHFARRERARRLQAEQLQARLVATRLDALSAQLNPHFLFNALNSIAEMVHRDADAADRMLVGLGALLRASLEHGSVSKVPLREELQLLRHYLDIEAQRLGERLRVEWHVDADLDDALVPPLLLQPLAENAIVHAIAGRIRPGLLQVGIHAADGRLRIALEDDGGMDSLHGKGHGTGIANLHARLALLYGEDHRFEVAGNAMHGTSVRIDLPLQASGARALEQAA